MKNTVGRSDGAMLERALSLVNDAMFTVELQRRRARSAEPEDDRFVFRWWADLQFFIVALRRLRRAAEPANQAPPLASDLSPPLKAFYDALPLLSVMRKIGEHTDDNPPA